MRLRAVPLVVAVAGLAVLYFFAARLGLTMAVVAEQVTPVWPPTAIALTAVFLLGARVWPGILLGAFAVNSLYHVTPLTALAIASGNTLEALFGAWLLRRVASFNPAMERVRDVFALVLLAALMSPTVSATIGVTSLCVSGVQPWAAYGSLWSVWWIGDAMGDLLVAPALLTFLSGGRRIDWRRAVEALVVFVALFALSVFVFVHVVPAAGRYPAFEYVVFPLLIWAALRLGQRGTTTGILLITAVAVRGTIHGHGPFATFSPNESLISLQLFLAILAITTLALTAAISERNAAERRRAADFAVTQILSEAGSLEEATPRILDAICNCLDWDVGILWKVDEDEQRIRCMEVRHRPRVDVPAFEETSRKIRFASDEGLPGRVWHSGAPAWIEDVVQDPNFPRAPIAARDGLHGAFGFPIRIGARTVGVIEFFSREIRRPDRDPLRMFATVGAQIGQFIDRKRADQERAAWLARERSARAEAEGLAAELARANRVKDEFLAVLGHELRNPLAPIRHTLHVLGGLQEFRPETVAPMLEMMDRQVRHLVRLVDDLLDAARITRGKIELQREPLALSEIVMRAVESQRPLIDQHGLQLALEWADEAMWVEADTTRLEQVFSNLLSNAAKYTPAGGRITLSFRRNDGHASVRIADTGIGIQPEMLPRVFDLFVQGERLPGRVQEGLGVGLTLSRSLVELHGGRITASSRGAGAGSEFVVTLPLLAPPAQTPTLAVVLPSSSSHTLRILVVDDNVDSAESLAMLLTLKGYPVRIAHDGLAALELAAAETFDVALLDIELPKGMNGYELARRLRADQPQIRLMAITGFGQEEHRRLAEEAGFERHLVKPVDPHELRRILASIASSAPTSTQGV